MGDTRLPWGDESIGTADVRRNLTPNRQHGSYLPDGSAIVAGMLILHASDQDELVVWHRHFQPILGAGITRNTPVGTRPFQPLSTASASTGQPRPSCEGVDNDLFFDPDREKITQARKICSRCPRVEACLAEAMKDPGLLGIWGGTTQSDRRFLRAARERAKEKRQRQAGCSANPDAGEGTS